MNHHTILLLVLAATLTGIISTGFAGPAKEFLTEEEIEKIQNTQELVGRVRIYLDAAALRLKTVEDRLSGIEPQIGDPMELYSPEDLVDGYYRILRTVLIIVDDAFQKPGSSRDKAGKALKNLKQSTEKALPRLEMLGKAAEEKQQKALLNSINKAIDITDSAHEGAIEGLSELP